MKIGIDARKLGPYVKHLLDTLPEKNSRVKFVLFFDSRVPKKKALKYEASNVVVKRFPFSRYRKFISYAYSQILVSAFLAKERLSVFHAAAGTMPIVYPGRCVLNIWKVEKGLPGRTLQGQIIGAAKKVIVPTENLKKKLLSTYKVKDASKIVVMSRKPKSADIMKLCKSVVKKKKAKKAKKGKK